jgi:hypothetical protein
MNFNNIVPFEKWEEEIKSKYPEKDQDLLFAFVQEHGNLIHGFLKKDDDILGYYRSRFNSISEVVNALEENIKNGLENYFLAIEKLDIHTPENYDQEQREVYEREKMNFSGKFSDDFQSLPKVTMFLLKNYYKKS